MNPKKKRKVDCRFPATFIRDVYCNIGCFVIHPFRRVHTYVYNVNIGVGYVHTKDEKNNFYHILSMRRYINHNNGVII